MSNRFQHAHRELQDLTELSRELAPPMFRDEVVSRVIDAFSNARSALLVGAPGVGKSSVVTGVADRLRRSGRARLYELSVQKIMSGTVYLGEWETKLGNIIDRLSRRRSVIYFSDIWNLPSAGVSSKSNNSAWDSLRPRVEKGDVLLMGEVTDDQLLALQATPGFSTLFDVVEVPSLSPEQVRAIVMARAERLRLDLDEASANRLLGLCDHFLPASSGPGPAVRLVSRVRDYRRQKLGVDEDAEITPAFIERVFSVYSGLPMFVVSREATRPVGEISEWFESRIIGQRGAIDAVVQMIALFKAGLHDPNKPIGSFLFVGPTGVGKTELAKALATFLFGSERRLLRFDLSEFKDYHAFQMLVGNPDRPREPARLVDPVRARPFQVVLLDELEKAHRNIWDLLLQVLDDGRLTPSRGQPVNFRNTIIIATSNVGAAEAARRPMGFAGASDASEPEARMREQLEVVFRPEFLNRFAQVVSFHPLSRDEVRQIARAEMKRVLEREGITGRRLIIDVDDAVLEHVVESGYDHRYGARALKREVQRLVVMPIATLLLERVVDEDSIVRLRLRKGGVRAAVVETEASRAARRARAPVRVDDGRRFDTDGLRAACQKQSEALDRLRRELDLDRVQERLDTLDERRSSAELWREPMEAAQVLDRYQRLRRAVDRIAYLERGDEELREAVEAATDRRALKKAADRLLRHESRLGDVRRELVLLGDEGYVDALVELRPMTPSRLARDLLHDTYRRWARDRHYDIQMVHEPMADDEPVCFLVRGPYAFGYLRLEGGHHRVREGEDSHVVRVRVVPMIETAGRVAFSSHRALKKRGQLGGRIRSRVEIADTDLVVQNDLSLTDNHAMAEEVGAAWLAADEVPDVVVRRYDLSPFLVRDYLLDKRTGRSDALKPAAFHRLLGERVDAAAFAGDSTA